MAKKLFCIFFILALFGISVSEAKAKCSELVEEECSDTEYHSYMACMRRRMKRSADCDDSCGDGEDCNTSNDCSDCDCNYCSYNECASSCNSCCEQSPPPCATRTCCHQTCQSQCRTSSCRRNCRNRCTKKIPSQSKTSSNNNMTTKVEGKHNITTIINLHNVINNTNVIDTPIYVNNTNVNNITLETPESAPANINIHQRPMPQPMPQPMPMPMPMPQPQPQPENCCKIVGPRQCVQTPTYPFSKCFHYRKQYCGNVCQTPIMHAEPHQVCDQVAQGKPNCHEQIAYIPQPQPRCSYTTQWPYVSCNVQNPNCGGCYSHVVNGGSPPKTCPSTCYDSGFNVGPYYRQGPVYQPNLSPYGAGFNPAMLGGYPYANALNPMESGYQIQPLTNSVPYGIINITGNDIVGNDQGGTPMDNDVKPGFNPYPFSTQEFPIPGNQFGFPASGFGNKREAKEFDNDEDKSNSEKTDE